MAICEWCEREMTKAASCTVDALHLGGERVPMIRWTRGRSAAQRCEDCGVRSGGFHHPGCDLQPCPVCRGQMLSCGCRFDEDEPGREVLDRWIDGNGLLTERVLVGGEFEMIVHYDDVPESDITTVDGLRCTTPLRTVIDLAPEVDASELVRMVQDCLSRGLFTVEDALARLAEDDMVTRPGAELLRRALPS